MANKPLAKDRKGDYWWVDTRRIIEEEDFNLREEYGDLTQAAIEIEAAGLENLEPLTCYKKGEYYVVLKGYRRTRVFRILEEDGKIRQVRILLAPKGFKKEDMILDQITGNQGKHFTPWEQAKVLKKLRGLGWSEKDLIERSGRSKTYVRRLLSLADAPQKLINLVREGRVTATLAMDEIAEGKVAELIEKAESGSLPAPDVETDPTLFPSEIPLGPNKPNKTTKSDLQKPPSYKKITKWTDAVDEKVLSSEKLEVYKFIRRMLEGKANEEFFKKYFR